jgi:hypothetical protein
VRKSFLSFFISMFVLVPVGMIFGIVRLIVKKIGNRRGWKAMADTAGWTWHGNDRDVAATLRTLLERTLYKVRDGRHSISTIMSKARGPATGYICVYHYRSRSVHHETRMGGEYTLVIVPRPVQGPRFWLQHRARGVMAAVAEELAGNRLSAPADPAWSWLLVSSVEQFEELGPPAGYAEKLRGALSPGDALFLFEEVMILSTRGVRDLAWLKDTEKRITVIEEFVTGRVAAGASIRRAKPWPVLACSGTGP